MHGLALMRGEAARRESGKRSGMWISSKAAHFAVFRLCQGTKAARHSDDIVIHERQRQLVPARSRPKLVITQPCKEGPLSLEELGVDMPIMRPSVCWQGL